MLKPSQSSSGPVLHWSKYVHRPLGWAKHKSIKTVQGKLKHRGLTVATLSIGGGDRKACYQTKRQSIVWISAKKLNWESNFFFFGVYFRRLFVKKPCDEEVGER